MKLPTGKSLVAGAAAAVVLLCHAGIVAAHHSGVMWDETRTVTLEGVVKEFQFTNPHSWLIVDVRNEDGTTTTWGFENQGPNRLMAAGITKNTFPAGSTVTVTANPMKDGRPAGSWTRIVKEDGTVVEP